MLLFRVFQPSTPEAEGTAPRTCFIQRFGPVSGGMICFLAASLALPGGILISVVGWWVAALTLFRLSVRQTFKTTIALNLFNLAMVFAIGSI